MQDVFDTDLKEELEGVYESTVWSELEEDLKMKMMEYMTNNLKACNLQVPPQKVMMRRAKSFYSTRRNTLVTRSNPEKLKKRKHSVKANNMTYVRITYTC